MLELTERAEGVVISVRAQPGAKREGVQGLHGSALKIAVVAPPTEGRANDALVQVLRKLFCVKRADVELLSGASSRDKRFLIRGKTRETVEAKLSKWLG